MSTVASTGRALAFKVPRFGHFREGMRSNRWEREMWRKWEPFFQWGTLYPVLFADRLGFLMVMPRAEQPVDMKEIDNLPDAHPMITSEADPKPEDYGRLGGRVVALDYGLPDADAVEEQRQYYQTFADGRRPRFNGWEK